MTLKTVSQLIGMRQKQTGVSIVTAYDSPGAKQVEAAGIDMILAGDSPGMTILGYENTVRVTLADMIHHGHTVRRDAPNTFVVADVPIGTVGISMTQGLNHALKLYQETNTNAIKAEGAHVTPSIKEATTVGIPIVVHLGLAPQSVDVMEYKLQGAAKEATGQLILNAKSVEKAGAVALILEAIPNDLAEEVSKHLAIPVVSIGAGKGTDGQVLVYHDMLNYGIRHKARFVKQFADLSVGVDGLKQYDQGVKSGAFLSEGYAYKKKIMNEVNNSD